MDPDPASLLPLSPPVLHILLSLSTGNLHGYGIMLAVAKQSGGQYKIGPGTLYDNLKKLLHLELIEEAIETEGGNERRIYHLNEKGRAVLAAETERLAKVLREARRCLRLNPGRPS